MSGNASVHRGRRRPISAEAELEEFVGRTIDRLIRENEREEESMAEHTRGPWIVDVSDGLGLHVSAVDPDGERWCVAQIVDGLSANANEDKAICSANAHLIASAPDLLAACEAGRRYQEAIERVEEDWMRPIDEECWKRNVQLYREWVEMTAAAAAKAKGG